MALSLRPASADAALSLPTSRRIGPTGSRGRRVLMTGRRVGLAVLVAYAGAFLAYMVMLVPVMAPRLGRSDAVRHWPIAVLAGGLVMLVDAVVVFATARRERRLGNSRVLPDRTGGRVVARRDVPRARRARLERRRSRQRLGITGMASAALLGAALVSGYPLWVLGLAALIPWVTFFGFETMRTSHEYGFYAFFVVVVGFQVLHMGEHTVQVIQLAITDGDLAHSHGVLGQLDFELVHFLSDILVWLALCVLVFVLGAENRWVWVAFAAASAHAIEHLYLFRVYVGDRGFYDRGGLAGIMGDGGLIGSPLARPYLHFAYNFIVVVPLVLAWWVQMPPRGRRAPRSLATASP